MEPKAHLRQKALVTNPGPINEGPYWNWLVSKPNPSAEPTISTLCSLSIFKLTIFVKLNYLSRYKYNITSPNEAIIENVKLPKKYEASQINNKSSISLHNR